MTVPAPQRALALAFAVALGSASGCGPSGPPAHTSGALVPAAEALPTGHLEDGRAASPIVAVTNASGQTEIHDHEGLRADPIPGHEDARLLAMRATADGAIWACWDTAVALHRDGAWTTFEYTALGVIELVTGPCTSLDARSADDVYVGIDTHVCAWDGAAWDCFPFGATRAITLSPGNVWFVRPSARYDDLTVIDTVSRATPGLVRLGEAGSTEALVGIPGLDEVVVVARDPDDAGVRSLRRATPDGAFTSIDAQAFVPTSATDAYVLRVAAGPALSCGAALCGEGAEWSDLTVLRTSSGGSTEVGHLTRDDATGVPWRALLVGGALRVRGEASLFALP